jgi:hypothetical protein
MVETVPHLPGAGNPSPQGHIVARHTTRVVGRVTTRIFGEGDRT